jgi:phasin family protein
MTDRIFDANAWIDASRNTLAPFIRAQQEGLKAFERLARFQYAVAGDYIDWTVAIAGSALAAKNPADFVTQQSDLAATISEKVRNRSQEFVSLVTETQGTLKQAFNTATAKAPEHAKKAA